MPLARFGFLGNEIKAYLSEETLEVDFTARNRLWTFLYKYVIRPIASLPRRLFGERIPMTAPKESSHERIEFRGKSVVGVNADAPEHAKELARRASQIEWYHTFDLGHGIVTPGAFDHSPIVQNYRLPERLSGQRVLDVACFDGFWAMEFERRGAEEVVALDIRNARELDLPTPVRERMTQEELDRPMGDGFSLVHEAKQSKVRKVHCNVYDLGPDVAGTFDIVHIGDVLLHLQNPAKALQKLRSVTRGYALISDIFDPRLDRLREFPLFEYRGGLEDCVWWYFSLGGLWKMISDAGFRNVELITKFKYGMRGDRQQMWHAVFKASD